VGIFLFIFVSKSIKLNIMSRPIIRDAKILKYVESLESKLDTLSSGKVKAESYLSLKSFVESNNSVLKDANITQIEMSDKEDKFVDRAFKYADKLVIYNEMLDKLYAQLGEQYIEEVDRESASVYEQVQRGLKK